MALEATRDFFIWCCGVLNSFGHGICHADIRGSDVVCNSRAYFMSLAEFPWDSRIEFQGNFALPLQLNMGALFAKANFDLPAISCKFKNF